MLRVLDSLKLDVAVHNFSSNGKDSLWILDWDRVLHRFHIATRELTRHFRFEHEPLWLGEDFALVAGSRGIVQRIPFDGSEVSSWHLPDKLDAVTVAVLPTGFAFGTAKGVSVHERNGALRDFYPIRYVVDLKDSTCGNWLYFYALRQFGCIDLREKRPRSFDIDVSKMLTLMTGPKSTVICCGPGMPVYDEDGQFVGNLSTGMNRLIFTKNMVLGSGTRSGADLSAAGIGFTIAPCSDPIIGDNFYLFRNFELLHFADNAIFASNSSVLYWLGIP